ncbi:MAG TPA: SDR family NAD(P)-dependent oxidoreductase [Acidimicrobiia bacterium]|nr:SDR family NAD(P)-dependent oxidoreductase [Acidimicrobiia bacterium]
MSELTGMVAVVTGSAQGIGRAVALAMAEAGAAVAVTDIDDAAAEKTAAELAAEGHRAVGLRCDVTAEADVVALADHTEAALGPISIWVNNAGIIKPAMLHKMELADFDSVMSVHARGTFLGLREAARRMIASETPGSIINVTSAAGLAGTIGQINYSAAKGAIIAMTKSGARELARYRVRVNAVAPVAATSMTEVVRTDPRFAEQFLARVPLGRFADPEEVTSAYRWLASPSAGYVTGQVLCADGGLYMAS